MPKKPATHHKNHQAKPFLLKPTKLRPTVVAIVMGLVALTGIFIIYRSFAASDSLSLLPAASSPSLGSNFSVTIHENSGTDAINAVEADLTYDTSKLTFVSIDTTTSAFSLSAASSGGAGKVTIGRATPTTVTGDQIVAIVTFSAIGTGSTSVNFAGTSALVRAADTVNVLAVTNPGTYTIADTTAPSVPTLLTAGTKTVTTVPLTWAASTDNVGVTGYIIYRNLVQVGTSVTTSFTDTGLTPNTSYSYTVAATDAAGNTSAKSTALVTATPPDTVAPSVPTGVTAGTKTVTTIPLTWTASTDNVAVAGYNVFRNGVKVGTSTTTSYTDTGLTPNTSYSYTVSAFDAIPNTSAVSTALVTSTLADTTPPSVPTGLTSPSQTVNSIVINWAASTDNVAVTGYKIFRNSVQVGTSVTPTFTDTGLVQNTTYNYAVSAFDASGNNSAQTAASAFKTITKPGDINSDGTVGLSDLSILASNYYQPGTYTFSQGDLDGSTTVNVYDLSILARYWGT